MGAAIELAYTSSSNKGLVLVGRHHGGPVWANAREIARPIPPVAPRDDGGASFYPAPTLQMFSPLSAISRVATRHPPAPAVCQCRGTPPAASPGWLLRGIFSAHCNRIQRQSSNTLFCRPVKTRKREHARWRQRAQT